MDELLRNNEEERDGDRPYPYDDHRGDEFPESDLTPEELAEGEELLEEAGFITDPYMSMSNDEINTLAKRLYRNEIFTSLQIRPLDLENVLHMVFMPLALADEKLILWLQENDIHMFYGDMANTFGRAINGYPMFHSMGYLDKADTAKFVEKYNDILGMMGDVPKEGGEDNDGDTGRAMDANS